jgi:hypothetical protein
MAAPTPTVRVTPSGRKLGDGYKTLVTLAADTNIELWEKSVTPPGIEGDDPNDTTTMHNTTWRTKSPRTLATMTPMSLSCQYDPVAYSSVVALVNVVTTVTVHFPDGSTLAFYGFVKSFQPDALEEGKIPEAKVEIVPTNQDPVACTEESPVYTAGTGTSSSC